MTQEQLAELTDLSVKHIQRLESKTKPCGVRLTTVYRIIKAMKIKPSDLLDF